jgi:hypothetical protein
MARSTELRPMIEAVFVKEQRCAVCQFRTVPVPRVRLHTLHGVLLDLLADAPHYSDSRTPQVPALLSLSFPLANAIILVSGDAIRSIVI